ncbi:hypothetical protein DYQ86_24945 [Acidobacteria bacterium AB60]|nr:hypothetical protein DYQ86_24945 [Acidobacteria bacterium AB60]
MSELAIMRQFSSTARNYSVRSACIGFTDAARRAGMQHANIATEHSRLSAHWFSQCDDAAENLRVAGKGLEVLTLWLFSQGEMRGVKENLVNSERLNVATWQSLRA